LLDPADVPHGVHRLRPDEEAVAGLGRRRPPALDPILERPLEDVDDLLARMLVSIAGASGLISTRFWISSRPRALRSCCWREGSD
jgi:hypothetical protein